MGCLCKTMSIKILKYNSLAEFGEALGHGIFYLTLRLTGHIGAYLLLVPVISFYVIFSRKIHRILKPYLSRRFPEHNAWQLWWDVFHTVHSFGKVLVDRAWLGIKSGAKLEGTFDGGEKLENLINSGKGFILLIAHLGNWQSALSHLSDLPVKVHALMEFEEEAVSKHFFELQKKASPFHIIKADGFLGGLVEATVALQNGEAVTIMGDRFVGGPFAEVPFLGTPVRLPIAAYALAAQTGVPVVVIFAEKNSRLYYTLRIWDILYPHYEHRDQRQEKLAIYTKRFSEALENYVRKHPYQWYNFYDFWRQ